MVVARVVVVVAVSVVTMAEAVANLTKNETFRNDVSAPSSLAQRPCAFFFLAPITVNLSDS